MNEKQTIRFPLTAAYPFGAAHGLDREVKEIKDMEIEWDRSYTSTVRRGYLVELFEQHGIFDDLVLAVQRVPGVSLYRYKLSVSVELVSSRTYE